MIGFALLGAATLGPDMLTKEELRERVFTNGPRWALWGSGASIAQLDISHTLRQPMPSNAASPGV